MNLVLWRHFPINSERLFKVDIGSDFRIASFSFRHRLQALAPGRYDSALEAIHLSMEGLIPASLALQTALDSSVAFRFSMCSKDCLWL